MDCIIIDDTNTGFKPEPKLCHGISPTLRATRSGLKTICNRGGATCAILQNGRGDGYFE